MLFLFAGVLVWWLLELVCVYVLHGRPPCHLVWLSLLSMTCGYLAPWAQVCLVCDGYVECLKTLFVGWTSALCACDLFSCIGIENAVV